MVFNMSLSVCGVLLLCILGINAQYDVGDLCDFNEETGELGICTIVHSCKYAQDFLSKHERDIPMCSYMRNVPVVCCPINSDALNDNALNKFFTGTVEGVLKNNDLECRYNGKLPMTCCQKSNYPQPPEPSGCPGLPDINPPVFGSPAEEVAWSKCVENRRYFYMCVQKNNNDYERQRVCDINVYSPRLMVDNHPLANEFPHMAVLGATKNRAENQEENGDIAWVGTGSLISDKFILTAAHIVHSNVHGRLKYALLGTLNRTDLSSGELFNVVRLIPHKYYTTADKWNDIALLELDRQVRFSEFIRPICLPTSGLQFERRSRVIAGWGYISHNRITEMLSKEHVFEINSDDCKSQLILNNFTWNNDSMICTRGYRRRNRQYQDTCQADSGGPLMSIVTNEHLDCNYVLNGVMSWTPNCWEGTPSAYTRVSFYLDWIVETVWPKELANVKDKLAKRGDLSNQQ